jgi:hypothetical protein
MIRCFLALSLLLLALSGRAQAPRPLKLWDHTYGGTAEDRFSKVRATPDGGCLLAGSSASDASGDKSQSGRGGLDFWVVKLDASGIKQWDRRFGGPANDYLSSFCLTADGGYLLVGESASGAGADKSEASRDLGLGDFWVVKLDAAGNKQWDRTFGGSGSDTAVDVWPTQDGGYVVGGSSFSGQGGDKSQNSRGYCDFWVVKLDAAGNKQWDRDLGGDSNDYLNAVQQTADGGFLVGGYAYSGVSPDKSQPSQGQQDFWVIKLDATGLKQWDRTYGTPFGDELACLRQTPDGGYVLGGWSVSGSGGDKSQPGFGNVDFWVIKTDASGIKQWDRVCGGPREDYVRSLQLTPDGGYLLSGESYSVQGGSKTQPSAGHWDEWVVKLNAAGNQEWDRAYGGSSSEYWGGIEPTGDGGYFVGSWSDSPVSGAKSEPSRGNYDIWLVRLALPRLTDDARLCTGGQVSLTAPAGGAPYRWSTGATTSSITVTQTGAYSVVYTDSDGGPARLEQQVTAFVPPSLIITGDSLLCPGTGTTLTATAVGATAYLWSTGATTPAFTVTQPGTYGVQAFFGSGCSTTMQFRVRVSTGLAPFTLGADTTLCEGETLVLRGPPSHAAGETYRWSDGSSGPSLQVGMTGIYSLQIMGCGSQTASRRVVVQSCVQIGNVITPNEDGRNDRLEARNLPGAGWSLAVYNRWGRQVYSTPAYRNEWGETAAAGMYYYVLQQPVTGKLYKGWVEVIR